MVLLQGVSLATFAFVAFVFLLCLLPLLFFAFFFCLSVDDEVCFFAGRAGGVAQVTASTCSCEAGSSLAVSGAMLTSVMHDMPNNAFNAKCFIALFIKFF